jgi:hypothetical protein
MNLVNPYKGAAGPWRKGQLHLHTSRSDGEDETREIIREYERHGYDFICLTDHNREAEAEDLTIDAKLLVIPGEEYSGYEHPHACVLGVRETLSTDERLTPAKHMRRLRESDGVLQYNHPFWGFGHWPLAKMLARGPMHLLEVYNGVIEELPGPADATTAWDMLLTAGWRIFATATDDAHKSQHRNMGWVMVRAERTERAILDALRAGRFYASTGVTVEDIRLEGDTLTIESPDAEEVRFIMHHQRVKRIVRGGEASCEIGPEDVYLRVELFGRGAAKAWTQPIFVENEHSRRECEEFRDWLRERGNIALP